MRRLLPLLLVLAACKGDFPHYCDDTTPCTDPARPFCDTSGEYPASAGRGNVCIPTPGEVPDGGADDPDADPSVPPAQPALLAPQFGAFTGSVHAERSLKPLLRWNPSPGALTYDVQLEDSCPLVGFDTCAFPSPEVDETGVTDTRYQPGAALAVSLTPPVGRRYYWRTRACNDAGCSDWSTVRYLNVGRQASDYNGDGYGDRVVGATPVPQPDGFVGRAYVYFGGPSATGDTPDVILNDPQSIADGYFGALGVSAVGDANGDGYADLIVTSPATFGSGRAYLYLGEQSWPTIQSIADTRISRLSPTIEGLGLAVSGGGDINGDGFSDFAITAMEQVNANLAGEVYVYLGRQNWASQAEAANLVFRSQSASEAFGWSLSLEADATGDGLADLLVGANAAANPETNEGAAYLYRGQESWPTSPAIITTPDVVLDSPADEPAGRFGSALTIGDLDDDGIGDLVVGAHFMSEPEPQEGNVFLYPGRAQWPSLLEEADVTLDNPNDRSEGSFGYAVSVGDSDGDGRLDLLVGATTRDEEGEGFIFLGRSSWPAQISIADSELVNPLIDGAMGWSASLSSDWNGDGLADPTLGAPDAPDANGPGGDVFLWFGRETWPARVTAVDVTFDNPETDPSLGTFGRSMN